MKKKTVKWRTLINGRRVSELPKPLKWGFESKCPSKWVHIDCESGRVYVKNPKGPGWREPTFAQAGAAFRILYNEPACNPEMMDLGLLE